MLLTGEVDKDKNALTWNIVADEPISSLYIESSTNGTVFTTLNSLPINARSFSYAPSEKNTIYYRIKTMSATDQTIYSNVIALKQSDIAASFKIATMVHSEVTVNADENYQYRLADMSGRILRNGTGKIRK